VSEFFCVIILSYIAGSIPASVITGRIFAGVDIRKHGSGNAGASNVFRIAGPLPGILTALFDIFKGFFAAYFIAQIAFGTIVLKPETISLVAGTAAVAGHILPVFLKFAGGKGVATAMGMFIALCPVPAFVSAAIYIIVVFAFRISSIGSISAILSLPVVLTVMRFYMKLPLFDSLFYFSLIIAGVILFTHRENLIRIAKGAENKL